MDYENKIILNENGALSLNSTSSNILDLFVNSVRDCSYEYIETIMKKIWNETPEPLLKLICLTRDPRNGKGERDVSLKMISFLKKFLPKTYELNLPTFIEHGRYKDLLDYNDIPCSKPEQKNMEMEFFAKVLQNDLKNDTPTLAVKWAPRQRNPKSKILAKILFGNKKNYMELYRKNILHALSQKLTVVEQLMCSNKWSEINYSFVPSQAMKRYGKKNNCFKKQDPERFEQFLSDIKSGKTKVNTSGLQPHQIIHDLLSKSENDDLLSLQWNTILNSLKDNKITSSSMAVVDTSGSMDGLPKEVALSLGLLISELSEKPFKNKIITFSNIPVFQEITGDNLYQKIKSIENSHWDTNTNLFKVFELLLTTATTFQVPQEKMVKTLFIFTDMEFDVCSPDNSILLFDKVKQLYLTNDYKVPQIVFWNLRSSDTKTFPIKKDETGTVYLSGFSPILLKIFMEDKEFNPEYVLDNLLKPYNVQIHDDEKDIKF